VDGIGRQDIKMDCKGGGWGNVGWAHLTVEEDEYCAVVTRY